MAQQMIKRVPPGTKVVFNGGQTNPGGMARSNPSGTVKPLTPGRNVLEFLRQTYPGQVITESQLRVEIELNNSNNGYVFPITGNPATSVETTLDKNDIFGIESLGFYLTQRTLANPGNEELLTFPNNSLLDGTTGNVSVKDFYCIYNGTFQLTIGTTLLIPSLPMNRFLYVPQTQKDSVNAAIAATSAWTSPTVGAGTFGPFENQRDQESGQFRPHNIIQLSGAAQNTLEVTVATYSGMKIAPVTATIGNYLVFLAYGYIIKNAAYRGQALQ